MQYAGEYLDSTGLYHLRARQYNPGTGRFLTADPAACRAAKPYMSTYACASDNPANLVGPSGLESTAPTPDSGFEFKLSCGGEHFVLGVGLELWGAFATVRAAAEEGFSGGFATPLAAFEAAHGLLTAVEGGHQIWEAFNCPALPPE